jgi:hypothetical protein
MAAGGPNADGVPGARASGPAPPQTQEDATIPDQDALELGRRVLAVREALGDPASPGAMDAVVALGRDQRHYVMVRGWLGYQLQADLSIGDARKEDTPVAITRRIDFLRRAIRAIDLE